MLAKIARRPSITVSELAESLAMDQTTVSRNLRVLERSGYISLDDEMTDHRVRRIRISDSGISKMNEAIPFWEKAQLDMERLLGRENIDVMMDIVKKLTR
jgi:DNA-binding MarR family transcriptional regulator